VLRFNRPRGAFTRRNNARHSHCGRRRRYETIASPTSTGKGSRSYPTALPVNEQQPATPVDIIERDRGDLAGAQPKA
jgi:predicted NBD/HSP70 family sugar kinase